jgi:hypothetical protein
MPMAPDKQLQRTVMPAAELRSQATRKRIDK